jgi:ribose transport system substrate-binding protein
VDNEQAAYLAARYISDAITEPTQAIVLEGIRGARNADDRKNGALRAFGENPYITVVATKPANWKIDEAYRATKALFARYPSIGAIFCANDMMAFGALNHLQEAGRSDVLVASFDALAEAKQAIREGRLAVTIDQRAEQQGYLGIQYAVRALAGEQLPPETIFGVTVVDAASLK